METPTNTRKSRPPRNPTPRLSDRKKNLFKTPAKDLDENLFDGIEFLDTGKDGQEIVGSAVKSTRRSIAELFEGNPNSNGKTKKVTKTPTRRSPRSNHSQILSLLDEKNCGKENNPENGRLDDDVADEQFQNLFINSMRLDSNKLRCEYGTRQKSLSEDELGGKESESSKSSKRPVEMYITDQSVEPQKKLPKTIAEPVFTAISTKQFYSASMDKSPISSVTENNLHIPNSNINSTSNTDGASPKTHSRRRSFKTNINRGVKHKIRRARISGTSNNRLSPAFIDVELILKNVRNEKLKNIISSRREERKQIEEVHNILRTSKNPIAMARPLSSICRLNNFNNNNNDEDSKNKNNSKESDEADFSEIEYYSEENDSIDNDDTFDDIIPLISHKQPSKEESIEALAVLPSKRKFFKSSRVSQTPKEITITENIKASLYNGKISLVQEDKKPKKKYKRRISVANEFSNEQATVDAILEKLNNSALLDASDTLAANELDCMSKKIVTVVESEPKLSTDEVQLTTRSPFSEFRKRIPYKTNDKSKIEQQCLLLDFLINNNLCTEENFTIFIADPDNHKEEAARIVDQVFVLVNEADDFCDFNSLSEVGTTTEFASEQKICNENKCNVSTEYDKNSSAKDAVTSVKKNVCHYDDEVTSDNGTIILKHDENALQSNIHKVVANQHNMNTLAESSENMITVQSENLFPIFYKNQWKPLRNESKRTLPRIWNGGQGDTQYQIDAGQRYFGAQQCKQCGLVYSIHEPEEEKLHREYHSSLHFLRFKGWIDEDIVAIYPEWGADGRVLRIAESSNTRKLERLTDILKIVDQELGFSTYKIPKTFVAYLAVRKCQIVGLCLVQPLQKAHKYINVNGIDCCSQEEFPARCGISRLWVSPLHRRFHIATKLIQVVQQNTIFGEEIPLSKIGFSAPTECGKLFAQKITQCENFLVYQ